MPRRIESDLSYQAEIDFLNWLKRQNRANSILLGYSSVLRRYANFLQSKFEARFYSIIPGAQNMYVRAYIDYLKKLDLAPQTINFHIFALKAYYRSIGYGGHSVEQVYTPPREVRILSDADQARFLWLANRALSTRDRLVVFLAFYGCLTVAEIAALNIENIRITSKATTIEVSGSRLKGRKIVTDTALKSAVKSYVKELKATGKLLAKGPLFCRDGRRIKARTFQEIATDIGSILRLPFSLRLLRNTGLANQSRDKQALKKLARRSGLQRRQSMNLYRRAKPVEALDNNQ